MGAIAEHEQIAAHPGSPPSRAYSPFPATTGIAICCDRHFVSRLLRTSTCHLAAIADIDLHGIRIVRSRTALCTMLLIF